MMIGQSYIEGIRYKEIRPFFQMCLSKLDEEFERLVRMTRWAAQDLFTYNERALIGLFNNALIRRNDEYCTFQEYQVYEKDEQAVGRADLLVAHKDFDLLFEAKKWEYDGREYEDCSVLFKEPRAQLEGYYNAEKEYFKKDHTFLGILVFEYVTKGYLEEIRKVYTSDAEEERGIHFDAFYVTGINGLMVYGQVFRAGDLAHE